ncbi:MAG TPA: hypothetical protein VF145_00310, partial [Chitinophagaceae bacterium]
MALKERFEIPGKMRTWSLGLILVGLVALILGFVVFGTDHGSAEGGHHVSGSHIFWGTLMYNSLFFL